MRSTRSQTYVHSFGHFQYKQIWTPCFDMYRSQVVRDDPPPLLKRWVLLTSRGDKSRSKYRIHFSKNYFPWGFRSPGVFCFDSDSVQISSVLTIRETNDGWNLVPRSVVIPDVFRTSQIPRRDIPCLLRGTMR